MATPVITNIDNVNKTYKADGVDYAINPATGRYAIASSIKPVPNSSLQPSSPITLPTTPVDTLTSAVNASNNELVSAQTSAKNAESGFTNANTDLQKLTEQLSGKTTDTQALEQEQGIPQINQDLKNLQDISRQKTLEYNTTPYSLEGQGRGITTGILRGQEAVKQRQLGYDIMVNNANIQAKQGNLALAQATVDRALSAKYDPILAKIDAQKSIIDNNKFMLSRADQKLATAKSVALDAQKDFLRKQQEDEKDLHSISLTLAKNNAPQSVISSVSKAKSFNEAVMLATPYLMSASDKADIAYKVAQTAKIYSDIRNEGGSNVDPAQALAYGQQYASTGQIPTGIPKGSFSKIAQVAKELPKQNGTLVDSNTGVKPSKLSADEEKGITATYDIVKKKLPLLLEKFNSINTGVVGGTLGNVYTSQDRQDFETTRGEILNLLLQARSGATVSPQEYERYSKLIPTTFNQAFFFGSDGEKKIRALQNSLDSTLDSKLKTSGASIFGYSKVDLDGKEYIVGDIIKRANGQTGRVNADGSITLIQ